MQTIPEQFASAGRAQFQAQLDLLSSIAVATVENTGKLASIQLDASRAALGRSYAAWSQMLTAGPQNLFQLMSKAQSDFAAMLDSARGPFAAPAQSEPATGARADDVSAPGPEAGAEEPHQRAAVTESRQADAGSPQQISEPHAGQPPLQRTAIAEAASEVAPEDPAAVSLAAAPVTEEGPVTLPKVKPPEAVPPAAHSDGPGHRKGAPRR